MFCPKCGKDNSLESMYCNSCGERLTAGVEAGAGPVPTRKRFTRTHLIMAGIVLLLLAAAGAFAYRHYAGADDEAEGLKETAGLKVTVGDKTIDVERQVENEKDLGDEYSADTIYGQVLESGSRYIAIKSLKTGKVYPIFVGRRTRYSPRRHPRVGEQAKILYHLRRGHLIGDRVDIG